VAKKRKKRAEGGAVASERTEIRFQTVGWAFWTVAFFILLVPLVWGSYRLMREDTPVFAPIAIAAGAAAVLASVLAMGANSALQHRARQQRQAQKKKARR